MKGFIIRLICYLLFMGIALANLLLFHTVCVILLASSVFLLGLGLVIYDIIELIGSYRIYRFYHWYCDTNIVLNQSIILRQLGWSEIWDLRRYHKDLFKHDPVLVDTHYACGNATLIGHSKVTGWIKASSRDEAIRTLHYYNFQQNLTD